MKKRIFAAIIAAVLATISLLVAMPLEAFAVSKNDQSIIGTKAILIGDVDQDGIITLADALFIAHIALGLQQTNYPCDINHDGKITLADALLSLRQSLSMMDYVYISDFNLRADKSVVFSDDEDCEIYLYLETDIIVPTIQLFYGYDGDVNNSIVMCDDAIGADDIAGDGVYSAKFTPNFSSDTKLHFIAKYNEMESNDVEVNCYIPISEETLNAIETVDDAIEHLLSNESFTEQSDEEKAEQIVSMLSLYENSGSIENGSIEVWSDEGSVYFNYLEGILGGVQYSYYPRNIFLNDASNCSIQYKKASLDTNPIDLGEDNPKLALFSAMPGFESTSTGKEKYISIINNNANRYSDIGYDTTSIIIPTVSSFRTIGEYDIALIDTHGGIHKGKPEILLSEKKTKEKNKLYEKELKDKQIRVCNTTVTDRFGGKDGKGTEVSGTFYSLQPKYFEKCNGYNKTVVFLECCKGFGEGKGYDYSKYNYKLAEAIKQTVANTVIGFHNDVMDGYANDFFEFYIYLLIHGLNSKTSFDAAIENIGDSQETWYNENHGDTLADYYNENHLFTSYNPMKHNAFPVHYGDETYTVINVGILNGDFEKKMLFSPYPSKWNRLGDVRSITKLGTISTASEDSQRMALITTGIGSQQSESFSNGTEGSRISQTFIVPENTSRISFQYNFVSEEPMEYVGSYFDDSFCVQIIKSGNIVINNKYESINTSSWIAAEGVDFIDGDNTAFQTGWKTAEIDVSAYRGQIITLCFVIYDVGDEIFDSACLIDNVVLK